ncbi:putative retinoid-inducible serine carboxypeptidase [Tripterygium wilfordii]|uniref:Putative retinoid-inducible serine carboxypeptidase n=1 Tax=Tripterygium wilfordii TaxID=458696 RepID=A0A7J7C002_TRIWF|nr:putative retinoid-inducible serine carboxypeptidase [Tripterygium wilfordii]
MKKLAQMEQPGDRGLARKIKQQISKGRYVDATNSWSKLEGVISSSSNHVDIYNFLLNSGESSGSVTTTELSQGMSMKRYSRYLSSLRAFPGGAGLVGDLDSLMDGEIRKKLKIIPPNVTWGGQANFVFSAMAGDFMRPRINEVPVDQPCIALNMVGAITQSLA